MLPKINSAHGSDTRNIINRAIEVLNQQGKTILDLVAEGQLTPEQFAELYSIVNAPQEVADEWYQRFETKYSNLEMEYASDLSTIKGARSYVKYGNIKLPDDFSHNINFNIYRDIDGKMKHNFDIDAHLQSGDWGNATYIYLSNDGSPDNDGLTESTAIRSLETAFSMAESMPNTHFIFKILSEYYTVNHSHLPNKISISKNIAITSDEECFIGNIVDQRPWTEEDGVYYRARGAVRSIYDNKYKGIADLPSEYKKVDSLEECKATRGSFYTDGDGNSATFVYMRTFDDRIPDDDILLSLGLSAFESYSFGLTDDVQFIFKNINIIHYMAGSVSLRVDSTGTTKGHLIMWNSKIIESGNNGLMTNGVKYTWLFDTVAYKATRDGLNYHNTIDGEHFILEFNCTSFENGINDTNKNNNCSTAHEEAIILRVNTKGWRSRGPLLADVNGCYSISYDCNFTDSVRDYHPTDKVAYQFANVPYGDDDKGQNGKAIMINCEGGGEDTALLATGGQFEKVQVRNLKGDYTKIVNTNIEFIP